MKNIILLLITYFLQFTSLKAQLDPADKEIKDNIQYFRNSTISFGIDTTLTFQNIDGKIVTKRIFYTVGTGVLFYIKFNGYILECIVTAKHVLQDKLNGWTPKSLQLRYSSKDSLSIDKFFGDEYQLFGDKNLPTWFEHPDSTIDIAAIVPFSPSKDTSRRNVLPYWTIPNDEEYFEGKEVFVLGYPGAVGIDLLQKAVLRKGVISWVPTDINQSGKRILIDCNIFPGNSGGPVFSIPKNVGVVLMDTFFLKPKFYGIVSQRRFSNNNLFSKGKIILDASGNPINSVESIGIGVIITAKKVRELLNSVQIQFDKWAKEQENVK